MFTNEELLSNKEVQVYYEFQLYNSEVTKNMITLTLKDKMKGHFSIYEGNGGQNYVIISIDSDWSLITYGRILDAALQDRKGNVVKLKNKNDFGTMIIEGIPNTNLYIKINEIFN